MPERKPLCNNFWILTGSPDQLPQGLNQPEEVDYSEIGQIKASGVYSTKLGEKTLIRVVGSCPNLKPTQECRIFQNRNQCLS